MDARLLTIKADMTRLFSMFWFCLCALMLALNVQAAPKKVVAQYEVTRKGQPFAKITETFTQENGQYHIESVTKGIGVYALFGERKVLSDGIVTSQGLKPQHFSIHQGKGEGKAIYADFDWDNKVLSLKVKDKASSVALEENAQDILSFSYQWMFVAPQGDVINMPVTTGRNLRVYQYKIDERNQALKTAAGEFKTIHLMDNSATDEKKQLWLAQDQHHLIVKLMMFDEGEKIIEQTLSNLRFD